MSTRVWLRRALVAAVAAVVGLGMPVRGDEPARPTGPFVVVVGAGEFQDKAIDPRPTADADARALYDVLTDPKYLGAPPDRARLLVANPAPRGPAQAATRDAIIKAVEAALGQTGKDDLIILAFFGRGATVGDKTVFLTPNADFKDRATTALLFGSDLEAAFRKARGQKILLLMDVHYKGYRSGEEKLAEPTLTDVDGLLFGTEDKEESVRTPDRLLLLSGFVSSDPVTRGDQGLFAGTVIDALKGAADSAPHHEGYAPDGVITADELVAYLNKEIPDQARKLGKTDKEKEGQAVAIEARTSHFPVTSNPAVSAGVRKRLDAVAALVKAQTVQEEVGREGAALLGRMPKLKALQQLRKNYEKLADGAMTAKDFLAARSAIRDGMKLPAADADAYAQKVTEAAEAVAKVYVKPTDLADLTIAAIKGMYRRIEEPLPADLAETLASPSSLTEAKRTELLRDARARLGKREDLDENRDADAAILMMLASLNDPYTVYYDKETTRRMASALRGRFPGVGMQVRRDAVHDALFVVSPIKGSPAFDAGIRAGDLIVEIRLEVGPEGKPLADGAAKVFSTRGMNMDGAIALISGKPGTPVTLVLQRDGEKEPRVVHVKRNWVSVETVMGVKRNADAEWDYLLDPDYKIGYARLTQFTQSTTPEFRQALEGLKKNGLDGLVLDLRGNPGGFLTAAAGIAETFVGTEKLVTVRPRPGGGAGRPRTYRGEKAGDSTVELVVLVNGHSASASEIVAGCLQDHERAAIVGERSYGKGSVQEVLPFAETGGEMKLTIARYFPPLGRNIDRLATRGRPEDEWGVRPDKGLEVPLSPQERNNLDAHLRELEIISAPGAPPKAVQEDKDRQLKVALAYLRNLIVEKRGTSGK